MSEKPQAIAYARDPSTRNQDAPYERKFGELIKAITQGKARQADCIIISEPWVIGDNYTEVIESLSRLAENNLALRVVQRSVDATRN